MSDLNNTPDSAGWHEVDIELASVNLTITDIQSVEIPQRILEQRSSEFLVYAWYINGDHKGSAGFSEITFWVELSDGRKCSFRLAIYPHKDHRGAGVSYTSDNFWLPIPRTDNPRLFFKMKSAVSKSNSECKITVIGWR